MRLTVLRCLNKSRFPQAKVWKADGTVGRHGANGKNAANWTHEACEVETLEQLAATLTALRSDASAIVIRGQPIAGAVLTPTCRRDTDTFADEPLDWMMVDVDRFEPVFSCPVSEGAAAVAEYIAACLPAAFQGAGYYWQLSSSAGEASQAVRLKAHVWFGLAEPSNGATLAMWARGEGLTGVIDESVFRTVQPHFVADPVLEHGVATAGVEAAGGERSGFVPGGPVALDLSRYRREGWGHNSRRDGGPVALAEGCEDLALMALAERSLLRSDRGDGGYNISCPFESSHSMAGPESETVYWPAGCGPRDVDHPSIVCLHASCAGRSWGAYETALGLDELAFAPLVGVEVVSWGESGSWGSAGKSAAGASPVRQPPVMPAALFPCTDMANANRLIRHHKGDLIVSGDRWLTWDGKCWSAAEMDAWHKGYRLSRIIKAEAAALYERAAAMPDDSDEVGVDASEPKARKGRPPKYSSGPKGQTRKAADELLAWAAKAEDKHYIDSAMTLAKRVLTVDATALDADPWALNCLNGVVDLRTGELRPHRREDLMTKIVGLEYDRGAVAPRWESFLTEIVGSADVAAFLRRWYGYCATGDVREHKFVVHYGEGRNGKGTAIALIESILGPYAITMPPGMMLKTRNEQHSTGLTDLKGARMVTGSETGDGARLDEALVKQLTGGDKIKARRMAQDFIEFAPTHKIQLLTNFKPQIAEQSFALWQRVLLVPYVHRYGEPDAVASGRATRAIDKQLADQLTTEKAGILAWLVRGAVEWAAAGLRPPAEVLAAVAAYQSSQDRVALFVAENCELGPERETTSKELYAKYCAWSNENGLHAWSKQRFAGELVRAFPMLKIEEAQVKIALKFTRTNKIKGLSISEGFFD
jgi:putative DNA primase/helicase